MTQTNEELLMLGKRCYTVAKEQRTKDITMCHPLTGADITDPWFYFDRMYRGFQYDFVQKMATWASMPVGNKVFSGVEAYATMLCDSKPAISIQPREPSDTRFANIAKAGMSYWWDSEYMENTISVAVKASRIFGISWFHTYFDKDEDTVKCEAIHPSHVLVDPNCKVDNFNPDFLIYEYKVQYGALKARYDGQTLPNGEVVDFSKFNANRQWTLETYNPQQMEDRWKNPVAPTSTCNVYELWYRDPEKLIWEDEIEGTDSVATKSKLKYPRGRVITLAGGTVIDDKENPYKHGQFPFTPVHAYVVPGRFYGMGDVQQVMNTQIMRNRFSQLIIDSTMKSGGGWMFLGAGSGLKPSHITQGPFNIVPCKDASQIRIERPPVPSRHVFDFIQVLDADFDDQMGIHEISRGATLTSHKTAQEISVMAESDRTRVRQAARNLIWSLKRVSHQVMWDLAQFKKGEWFVRIAGDPNDIAPVDGTENGEEQKQYEDIDFNGKMLLNNKGDELKFDITFADDATLPNSQSDTFAKIDSLLKMQVVTPDDVLKYKLVDIPYSEQIYQDRQAAIQAEQDAAAQAAQAATPAAPGGAMPPDMAALGGGAPMPPMPGAEGAAGAIPPDLMAMLGAGMGAPTGDPITDALSGQPTSQMSLDQMLAPQGGVEGMPPQDLASLVGGAAVPTSPEPGVDPLAGLVGGETAMPTEPDMEMMKALLPVDIDLDMEEIDFVIRKLAEEYGLPMELILKIVFEMQKISEQGMGRDIPRDAMGNEPQFEDALEPTEPTGSINDEPMPMMPPMDPMGGAGGMML